MLPMPPLHLIFPVVFITITCMICGCGRSERYDNIALSDPALKEFGNLLQVNRAGLGIPPLPAKADVSVERSNGSAYDAMLHIYARHQQRTIAFQRVDGAMKWIGEQVVVDGPRQHTTVDGTFAEQIALTYETSRVSHYRLNHLNISYDGPDENLHMRTDLTAADVKPLLDQWLARP